MTILSERMHAAQPSRFLRPGNIPAIPWGPLTVFLGAIALCVIVSTYVFHVHSPETLLPVVSALLFSLGGLVAAVAWRWTSSPPELPNYRDVAGVLVLLGVCVAAAIEPDQMVRLLEDGKQR